MRLKPEIFFLEDEESLILYVPLLRFSARLNQDAADAVRRRMNGEAPLPTDEEVLQSLEEYHLFDEMESPFEKAQLPTHITIFPTDGCNLRCRYCYASAEKARHFLSPNAGKAAIRYAAENAKALKIDGFEVAFHGNGEPFTAFPLVKELTLYAHELAQEMGLNCWIGATSNGVLSEEQLDWVLAFIDDITISFDGIERLQNEQRPMADGSGSFAYADRTLRRLNESGKPFSIRTTLTRSSCQELVNIAAVVAERYPNCHLLHIEPSWESGRSILNDVHSPDPDQFLKEFLKAEDLLRGKMRLVYSADRVDYFSHSFCAASERGFTLTAEGLVTACYEVCERCDSRAERFIYGRYDPESDSFVLDEEKLAGLSRLTVENMPFCRDCFCKYHCCGDCPAKLLGCDPPENHRGSARCIITRGLAMRHISERLREQ